MSDIWICAGQSNMAMPVAQAAESAELLEAVDKVEVQLWLENQWQKATAENLSSFSAVAWAFGEQLYRLHPKPIGLVVAARGGTSIEAWLPADDFPDTATGRRLRALVGDPEVLKAEAEDQKDFLPYGQHRLFRWGLGRAAPATLFKQCIGSLVEFKPKGVLWYQGESNAITLEQAKEYHLWLTALIRAYRRLWHEAELPFIIIQLPHYVPPTLEGQQAWAIVQKAQAEVAKKISKVQFVDIRDCGEEDNLHPRRKLPVGQRAALVAAGLLSP